MWLPLSVPLVLPCLNEQLYMPWLVYVSAAMNLAARTKNSPCRTDFAKMNKKYKVQNKNWVD